MEKTKQFIVQEVIDGILYAPELFSDEKEAVDYYIACLESNIYEVDWNVIKLHNTFEQLKSIGFIEDAATQLDATDYEIYYWEV